MRIHTGDWVEVRSKEAILATLDKSGRLDGLPFMPQMLKYCGQPFRVYKVAHKTCDTVDRSGGRWLPHGIHLDLRCDGEAYGGCQAACLLFWKEAWLKPLSGNPRTQSPIQAFKTDLAHNAEHARPSCSENDVAKATSIQDASGETVYQ